MKCPKCQAENSDDAQYCSLCFARFHFEIRSGEADQAGKEMAEKHKGAQLKCPGCGELTPLDSPFCLKCAFVFEDPESIMVDAAEVEEMHKRRNGLKRHEEDEMMAAPLILTKESDGNEIMRHIGDAVNRGYKARVHVGGRNGITHALKVIALLGEDLAKAGKQLYLRVNLISEGVVVELDDVELEIIIEAR
ncbi:MAG: hypothetical protein A2V52_04095 [Actinobacteria bacterium RBG_19FT_COMBO_54_7]|nr:MAG: hypothetical protein A2V52_04095 [Actinobacteria bacterium RBG_19FT_COMBO_54_7]